MNLQNPGFDYDKKQHNYANIRQADARIMSYVEDALRGTKTVLNVGAGTGSYEPRNKYVVAVEPSEKMRQSRLGLGRNPAIAAAADKLPFDDGSFDSALAILTVHHWPDLEKGLREVRRVCSRRVVILTYDPDKLDLFWNVEYFPEVVEVERKRYPKLERINEIMGINATVTNIKIPFDCSDGFQEAFYGRPERFLDAEVRRAQSAWGFIGPDLEAAYVQALKADLDSGAWDRKYGAHRRMKEFEGAYRVLEFDLS